jgi:ferredoxin-thioredoxin reductase catalytic subunit
MKKRKNDMKIYRNKDEKIRSLIEEGILKNGGYCPCRRERIEDNKCICQEFRDQIADPNYEGYCHCMLYYKEK